MSAVHKLFTSALPRAARAYQRYFVFTFILFVTCIVVGFTGYTPAADGSVPWALKGVADLTRRIENGALWSRALELFLNNLKAIALSIAFGWILGIVPLISCGLNGVIIGMGAKMVMVRSGWSLGMVVLSFLPLGVLEIPAFIAGQAIGLRIGFLAPLVWRGRTGPDDLGRTIAESVTLLAFSIVPMLALAALLELTLTPAVIRAISPGFPSVMP